MVFIKIIKWKSSFWNSQFINYAITYHSSNLFLFTQPLSKTINFWEIVILILTFWNWNMMKLKIDNKIHWNKNSENATMELNFVKFHCLKFVFWNSKFYFFRFGQLPSLDPYGRHQSYLEYYLLDIIAIGFTIFTIFLYINWRIVKCVFSYCCKSKKSKQE